MSADGGGVERLHAQAEMVDVARFGARRGATHPAQLAIDRHQVDHRAARTQLHQADVVLSTLRPGS
jgi:hypothetical protein